MKSLQNTAVGTRLRACYAMIALSIFSFACSIGHPLTGILPPPLPEDDTDLALLALLGFPTARAATDGGTTSPFNCAGAPLNFQSVSGVTGSWKAVSSGNGRFVAVESTGNDTLASTDGISWSGVAPIAGDEWSAFAFGNGRYVGVASALNTGCDAIMHSANGVSWTGVPGSIVESNDVIFGDGRFVAVGGTVNSLTSPDGAAWTTHATLPSAGWKDLAYGGGVYVAVDFNKVTSSPDGISWTAHTPAEANIWRGVAYGDGLFVAVSSDGTNRVMTSTDGANWSINTTAPAQLWSDITYQAGRFVAAGITRRINPADRIVTSAGTRRQRVPDRYYDRVEIASIRGDHHHRIYRYVGTHHRRIIREVGKQRCNRINHRDHLRLNRRVATGIRRRPRPRDRRLARTSARHFRKLVVHKRRIAIVRRREHRRCGHLTTDHHRIVGRGIYHRRFVICYRNRLNLAHLVATGIARRVNPADRIVARAAARCQRIPDRYGNGVGIAGVVGYYDGRIR